MSQNFHIYTNNYKLNLKQEKKIQTTIDNLSQKIPCNSIIRINLDYNKNLFSGKMEIITNKKTFFSHDSAETISQLMKSLNKKTIKQIMKWKQNRTREEITGIIDLNNNFELLHDKTFKKAS